MTEITLARAGPGARRMVEPAPGRTLLIGDYGERGRTSTWDEARRWLDAFAGGRVNIAHEAADPNACAGLADALHSGVDLWRAPQAERAGTFIDAPEDGGYMTGAGPGRSRPTSHPRWRADDV